MPASHPLAEHPGGGPNRVRTSENEQSSWLRRGDSGKPQNRERVRGYAPRAVGHYVENTGDTDLRLSKCSKATRYESISLADWTGPDAHRAGHRRTHMSRKALEAIPKRQVTIMPV